MKAEQKHNDVVSVVETSFFDVIFPNNRFEERDIGPETKERSDLTDEAYASDPLDTTMESDSSKRYMSSRRSY